MASAAASDLPPTPAERPGGWLSGLVSGAGRLLAAVLGPDSPDSGTGTGSASSTPESSQSPSPPCGPRGSRDHCNTGHFARDSYQFNQSGKEIVLKDCGEGSLALVSEIEPKHAIMQLLLQETYSRSECDKLIKIIQERVVDSDPGVVEPSIVLPIAWQASQQQDPVEYSSFIPNTCSATSNVPGCSQQFDRNIAEEKKWLDMKRLSPVEGPCVLNTDWSQYDLKRSHSNTGDTVDESHCRSIRPKLDGLNISNKQDNMINSRSDIASFDEATTKDLYAFRDIPEDTDKLFKDTPLLGTDNLTFSDIVSYDDTANDIAALHGKLPAATAQTSCQSDWDNRGTTMFYPYSNQDLVNTFPIKVKTLDDIVHLEPDIMDLARKNHDTHTICNDTCSVSKLMFQEDIESIPSSSRDLQLENSSRNFTDRASLQWSTPTKRRSTANVYRRQSNNNTIRPKSEPLHQGKPMAMGHEPDLGLIQAKKPVGRPKKSRRLWKATTQMENARRV
ncbi:hypothetical protein GUJ93_ZPchr0228g22251 [Zizania palustris]|uniref:Uncharacterized protein n=2 Tax=Zizania palustris TaxID=103762 RepID=A0A8J5QVT7_ZIZPA|nr:hypothetical protein GUJ93_ZPchr0228g22251 [Zizania palustris]